ncbi:MAG: PRC-barrel domain-containing protein [Sporomusaceae bacterium]|nr:PRC-barrel domain-containing protein [Sporomusaceae bacterium]
MKKSVDIIGLPVVDISEGSEIGVVTRIVINPIEGSIAALVIDDGTWYLGAKLLPFNEIAGLGEAAITIISSDVILTVENAPALEQLLRTDVAIIGTKVLTKAGHFEGTVKEIIIDKTGKVTVCEIEEVNGAISNISTQRVLTFGKKVLIVADGNEISPAAEPEVIAVPVPATAAAAKETANDDSARKFDEKQRKYLLGKQASRRIETDNGVLIVEQGGEINEEVLQKAKLAGKFVELSMNIQ